MRSTATPSKTSRRNMGQLLSMLFLRSGVRQIGESRRAGIHNECRPSLSNAGGKLTDVLNFDNREPDQASVCRERCERRSWPQRSGRPPPRHRETPSDGCLGSSLRAHSLDQLLIPSCWGLADSTPATPGPSARSALGAGLPTPPDVRSKVSPPVRRPSVARVARSETGHSAVACMDAVVAVVEEVVEHD